MILAIGHEAHTGKDTFAMFLIEYLRTKGVKNLRIEREGFVTRLYAACQLFYGWAGFQSREYYDANPQQKNNVLANGKKPYEILEEISDKLTEYDKQIFYNGATKTKGYHLKIIPDLRRPLEFEQLEKDGAYLLRIAKTGYTSPRRFCQYLLPYGDRFHRTIYNDGTIKELNAKAIEFCDEIVWPRLQKYLHGEMTP